MNWIMEQAFFHWEFSKSAYPEMGGWEGWGIRGLKLWDRHVCHCVPSKHIKTLHHLTNPYLWISIMIIMLIDIYNYIYIYVCMDGWMDGCMYVHILISVCVCLCEVDPSSKEPGEQDPWCPFVTHGAGSPDSWPWSLLTSTPFGSDFWASNLGSYCIWFLRYTKIIKNTFICVYIYIIYIYVYIYMYIYIDIYIYILYIYIYVYIYVCVWSLTNCMLNDGNN